LSCWFIANALHLKKRLRAGTQARRKIEFEQIVTTPDQMHTEQHLKSPLDLAQCHLLHPIASLDH
jgi:hypothetical protein